MTGRKGSRSDKLKNCIVGAILCLLIAGKGGYWVIKDSWLAYQSQRWPATKGIILSSKVHKSIGTGKTTTAYSPSVRYQFEVDAKPFIGSMISYPPRRGALSWAEKIIARYPAGETADIYYAPTNPKYSCLERGRLNLFFITMIGGLSVLFGGLGVWLIIFGFRGNSGQKPALSAFRSDSDGRCFRGTPTDLD